MTMQSQSQSQSAIRDAHREAMRIAGIDNHERVSIPFDVFAGDEEIFTITVKSANKRKRSVERGMGVNLGEALADLRDQLWASGLLAR